MAQPPPTYLTVRQIEGAPAPLSRSPRHRARDATGAPHQNNTAQVNGSGFTAIDQDNAVVSFTNLW